MRRGGIRCPPHSRLQAMRPEQEAFLLSDMDKKKKLLMWSILLIALFQMPNIGITPAINRMYTEVFTDKPLSAIQTAVGLTSMTGPIVALLWAFLIRKDVVTKRFVILFGTFSLSLAGVLALFLHGRLWHIGLLAVLLGCGAASYVPNSTSLLVDNFDGEQRRKVAGRQVVFSSLGGIFFCVVGGIVASRLWYGGYLLMMLMIPVAVYSLFVIPSYRDSYIGSASPEPGKKSKLNPDTFYYDLWQFFQYFLYLVFANNISVHFARSGISNPSVAAGFAAAVAMVGSFGVSNVFKKLSTRLGDMMIPLAYVMIFIGYTILNLFDHSLIMMFVGICITGTSMGLLPPQCVVSVSKRVDESTSAIAMAVLMAVAAGLGGFLSPIVTTNVTMALGGESTNFRYQFMAFFSLALAVIVFFLNKYRAKKQAGMYD